MPLGTHAMVCADFIEGPEVTTIRDLEAVVSQGLCTGCGICESMLGRDNVDMQLTSFGQLRPRSSENSTGGSWMPC